MRTIRKGAEPRCLRLLRSTPGVTWASVSFRDKERIRRALVRDQGGLCAYCMARIATADGEVPSMRVEHWDPRAEAADRAFAWQNLLGTCDGGGDGAPPEHQSCDRAKGKLALRLHPARPRPPPETVLKYLIDGTIEADGRFHDDVERVLRLNVERLRRQRASIALLALEQARGLRAAELRALIAGWERSDAAGNLREYREVALYFLQRKLRDRENRDAAIGRGRA